MDPLTVPDIVSKAIQKKQAEDRINLIREQLKKTSKLHYTLIDPEKQNPKEAGKRAAICKSYGTDAIMIGGSTVQNRALVHETVKEVKEQSNLPTILFPNSAETVSDNADYVFYMMLMNSLDRRFLIGEQVKAARYVKNNKIKPISMGYIVVSMGNKPTAVEKTGNIDRITGEDIDKAVDYALTAEHLNLECVYLEAGSGAEKPIPNEMITAVRREVNIPIIVGGGITDGKTAKEKTDAGADVIVNGTAGEKNISKIKEIIDAIKNNVIK